MQPDNEGYHIVAEGGIRQREAIGGVDEGDLLRVVMMGKNASSNGQVFPGCRKIIWQSVSI